MRAFSELPIKRKLMLVILLTNIALLILTGAGFLVYDLLSFRHTLVRNLSTTASIIAGESTGAVLFRDEKAANEILAPLRADPHTVAAALYDGEGNLFVRYPPRAALNEFPARPAKNGYKFEKGYLFIFQPVAEGDKQYGTLYLRSDLGALPERLRLYGGIALVVLLGAFLVGLGISNVLQRRISEPILALAETAAIVSERRDYSVRARKISGDELGLLTEAFNQMLARIQAQTLALTESEERKSAILESAIDCIVTMDAEGRILDFNPAAEKAFGHRKQDVTGKTVAEVIIPERLRAAHAAGLARFKETGQSAILGRRIEMPALRADGSEFPVELAIAYTPVESGPVLFTAYLRDITERKRAEEALSLFAAIVESSDDAIIGKDLQSRVVSWNAAAERMFGYTAAEMIGQSISRIVSPDRPEEEAKILAEVRQGHIRHSETVRVSKSGHPIDVSLTVSPIKTSRGDIIGFSSIARDITARKRSEKELAESRTRLSGVIGSAMDAIISVDSSQRITIFNAAAERMFKCPAAQAIGSPLDRFIPPRYRKEHRRHVEDFGRTGVTSRAMGNLRPISGIRTGGEEFPIEASISQIEIEGQRVYTVILRDITERTRVQQELRKSEAQLRLVWENALDGMRLVDEHGIIRMVNEAYCGLVEKPRHELEGKPLSVIYETQVAEEVMQTHRQSFQEQSIPAHQELEVALWNGKKLFLELSSSFLQVEGRPALLVTTLRDISRRKQSEKREAAFGRLGRSLSVAGSAGAAARVIVDTANELFGWDSCSLDLYSPQDDAIYPIITLDTVEGRQVDVAPAWLGQAPSPIMRKTLSQGAQLVQREPPFKSSPDTIPFGTGSRPATSLMSVPIRLGDKIIGILTIQSYSPHAYQQQDLDILQTLADQCAGALERVRAEEEVLQLNAQLEQRVIQRTAELTAANKELEAFTYSVAHDLRAPLRHIDAFTRILSEDFAAALPLEAQRYLENIRHGSRNMSRLVDDLLNLAQVGRQELKRQATPLAGLVSEVLADLKRETEGRSIEWHIRPLPTVECDSGLMKLVFANLLSNAIKYTRPRPVAVIEVGSQKVNGGDTALFVRDNGVGFSMKYADKLFGVFQRLHRAEDFEGTGVGLATVDRIVRKHGGEIWVEAAVDKGATFYFTVEGLKGDAEQGTNDE